jgi:hypothetical protein
LANFIHHCSLEDGWMDGWMKSFQDFLRVSSVCMILGFRVPCVSVCY